MQGRIRKQVQQQQQQSNCVECVEVVELLRAGVGVEVGGRIVERNGAVLEPIAEDHGAEGGDGGEEVEDEKEGFPGAFELFPFDADGKKSGFGSKEDKDDAEGDTIDSEVKLLVVGLVQIGGEGLGADHGEVDLVAGVELVERIGAGPEVEATAVHGHHYEQEAVVLAEVGVLCMRQYLPEGGWGDVGREGEHVAVSFVGRELPVQTEALLLLVRRHEFVPHLVARLHALEFLRHRVPGLVARGVVVRPLLDCLSRQVRVEAVRLLL